MSKTRVVNGVKVYLDKDGHWRRVDNNALVIVHENNNKGDNQMTEDQELKALQEHTAELVEQFEMIVAERVNEALETVAETVYHALSEELTEAIDGYLNGEVGEAVNELSEAVDGVENLIIQLADCGDDDTRKKFIARVAAAAQQQPRPEQGEYPGAKNQDGSHGIPDEGQATKNRQSLTPKSRLGEGVVARYIAHAEMQAARKAVPITEDYDPQANQDMRDEMERREKARKQRFHTAMMEHLLNRGLGGTAAPTTEPKSNDGNGVLSE